jgi:hypothetical protein
MKIRTTIDNIAGRYHAQVDTLGFTAAEEQQLADFGEPLIQVGGDFAASAARPGQTNTTVTIHGDGSLATAVPVIVDGAITTVSVTNMGTGYSNVNVTVEGDGTGASLRGKFGWKTVTFVSQPAIDPEDESTYFMTGDQFIMPVWGNDVVGIITVTEDNGAGGIVAVEVTEPGEYTNFPGLSFTARGCVFTMTIGISAVTVVNGGVGYSVVPIPVEFTLPEATRRLRSDSPFKRVFDLADGETQDVMAKVWADTIVSRCTAAKNTLMQRTSPIEGETLVTV